MEGKDPISLEGSYGSEYGFPGLLEFEGQQDDISISGPSTVFKSHGTCTLLLWLITDIPEETNEPWVSAFQSRTKQSEAPGTCICLICPIHDSQ